MKKITMLVRLIYGLFFVVMGLNYFYHFIPLPALSMEGGNFMAALASTGYLLPLNSGTQLVAGAMLLLNIFTPLALILLAPITLNILLFHIYLDPAMLPLAISIVVVQCFLALMYWDNYSHLFKKN